VAGSQRFFQKHATPGTPEAIRRVHLRADKTDYLAIDDLAGLVSLVQMGVLEIHPWGSRVDRPEKPDRMIFDLDPGPGVEWAAVIAAVRGIRTVLDELGLASFVKTTGGKGLHVVVPLDRRHSWDEVGAFSKAVAKRISAASPGRFTLSMAKAARQGRIYLDFLRNARGATAVAAYSTRAHDDATVSVPLAWEELSPHIGPDHFTVRNVGSRLAGLESDPWAELDDVRQAITAAMRKQVNL
jgi:bifunctional non-homologous end joining protein LigD